jgi:hypothetical protein
MPSVSLNVKIWVMTRPKGRGIQARCLVSLGLLAGCSAPLLAPSQNNLLLPESHKPPKIKHVSMASPLIGTWVGPFERENKTWTIYLQIKKILRGKFQNGETYQFKGIYRVLEGEKILKKSWILTSIGYIPAPLVLDDFRLHFQI